MEPNQQTFDTDEYSNDSASETINNLLPNRICK